MDFSAPFDSSPPAQPLRILCAEDHEQMGLLAKLVLERAGHYVEHAADGQEAWERLQMNLAFFDLLITDHQMPRLSGLQLTTRLHRAKFRGRIIVHSSSVGQKEEEAYRALGVDTFLRKPANLQQLLAAVGSR